MIKNYIVDLEGHVTVRARNEDEAIGSALAFIASSQGQEELIATIQAVHVEESDDQE